MVQIHSKLSGKRSLLVLLFVILCFSPLFGADGQRDPINVNVIIDGSSSFAAVKDHITTWLTERLDKILVTGDRVTIWSAGASSRVIYTGTINAQTDKDAVKRSIREMTGTGSSSDFSGALTEASGRQSSSYSYTLMISAGTGLSALLSGSQANLLRFSRTEEFSGWRLIIVGLDIDAKVRRAAAAFFQ
ncbi:MAG: hypothetical protein FWB86_07145 [Treponema sp.]|nr:hypothetical protein [Treponema sp.]MCL2252000.1 hypothetical protein [Treponema sp.]